MKITVEIREDAFLHPKSARQIEEELRQAAALFWLARGDVALDQAGRILAPVTDAASQAPEPTLYELVVTGPDLGDDADFERHREHGDRGSGSAKGFEEHLLSMPDVGDDADFERTTDPGEVSGAPG